jgi:hypothetical protein
MKPEQPAAIVMPKRKSIEILIVIGVSCLQQDEQQVLLFS